MAKPKCKFCERYKKVREIEKAYNDQRFQTRYYGELVTTTYNKEYKQEYSRTGHERVRLHYCPYCGKKLR